MDKWPFNYLKYAPGSPSRLPRGSGPGEAGRGEGGGAAGARYPPGSPFALVAKWINGHLNYIPNGEMAI